MIGDPFETIEGCKELIKELKELKNYVTNRKYFNLALMYGLIFGLLGGFISNVIFQQIFIYLNKTLQSVIIIIILSFLALCLILGIKENRDYIRGEKDIDKNIEMVENHEKRLYSKKQ